MMEVASNLFESILFVIFMTLFLKPGKEKRAFFCCASAAVVLLFLNITISDHFVTFSVYTIFFDFVIMVLFWKGCLEGSFLQFFIGFALYWFGICCSVFGMLYFFSLFDMDVAEASVSINSPYRTVALVFTRFLILLYTMIILYNREKFRYYRNQILIICYVVISVAVLGILMMLTRTMIDLYYIEPETADKIIYISMGICAMFVLILTLLISISRKQEKEREVRRLSDMIEVQKQALENYVAGERELHRQRHELEHKFYSIQYLLEQNRISEGMDVFQKTIEGLYGNARNMTISGNIIDTVIRNKVKKYALSRIELVKKIEVGSKENIDLVDLCILVGNLVENAMEAADKSETKKVRIEVKERLNCMGIFISNTFSESDSDVKNLLSKKKEVGKHGFGIQSVKEIVSRYQGEFETCYEGEWFYVKIIIYYQI